MQDPLNLRPWHWELVSKTSQPQELECTKALVRRMLLLLLSCFSRVGLCGTPETAAHQASPSLGLSRQEHWSGLPVPSPMHESEKRKWSCSVVSDSSDPMDCSLPGSSVHGIFQARVLEWSAIAFSVELTNFVFRCPCSIPLRTAKTYTDMTETSHHKTICLETLSLLQVKKDGLFNHRILFQKSV